MPDIIFFKYKKAKNHVTLIFSVIFWEKVNTFVTKTTKTKGLQ